jgi:multicomponent K+:H+ antiporter subunit G
VLHEILIAVFLTLTTPISLMLIVRAALARDRREGHPDVPRAEDPDPL